jgi:nitrite reductase/ring-hydroxylating ferredoxin subunit
MEYLVANEATLKQKKKMRVKIKNRDILLTSTENGIFAIQDKCPHRGVSLASGKLEDGVISCKDHGLPISVETGEVTDMKKAEFLKLDEFSLSVRTFKTIVKDGKVFVEM